MGLGAGTFLTSVGLGYLVSAGAGRVRKDVCMSCGLHLHLLRGKSLRHLACLGVLAWFSVQAAQAMVIPLPANGNVVGEYQEVLTHEGDTLIALARRYGLGFEEIENANPTLNPFRLKPGTVVKLPLRRILPDVPREGIVVNLPEHRLYYFPKPKEGEAPVVVTFPVSVGKMDWSTPIGLTKIQSKTKDPNWYPPESVRKEHEAKGDPLPKMVKAGPDNPLGQFAMRLAIPGGAYMIHGTNNPEGVGMDVTHGCMRLYPENIEALFKMVSVDTPVRLINEPIKVGLSDGQMWVEVHPALLMTSGAIVRPTLLDLNRKMSVKAQSAEVGQLLWEKGDAAFTEASGITVVVSLPLTNSPGA